MKTIFILLAFILTACSSMGLQDSRIEPIYMMPEINIYSDKTPWFDLCPATNRIGTMPIKLQSNASISGNKKIIQNGIQNASQNTSANHCREIDAGGVDANINAKLDCMLEVVKGF